MNIQGENKSLKLYNKEGVLIYKYFKNSTIFWYERTYNDKGNELTCKDSRGYWYEYTYNKNGNTLTYKHSNGTWHESTYNENGNQLTFKNSYGTKIGFDIPEYTMKDLVEKLGNFKLIK